MPEGHTNTAAGSHPYAIVAAPETGAVYAGNMPDPENTEAVYTAVVAAKSTK